MYISCELHVLKYYIYLNGKKMRILFFMKLFDKFFFLEIIHIDCKINLFNYFYLYNKIEYLLLKMR